MNALVPRLIFVFLNDFGILVLILGPKIVLAHAEAVPAVLRFMLPTKAKSVMTGGASGGPTVLSSKPVKEMQMVDMKYRNPSSSQSKINDRDDDNGSSVGNAANDSAVLGDSEPKRVLPTVPTATSTAAYTTEDRLQA